MKMYKFIVQVAIDADSDCMMEGFDMSDLATEVLMTKSVAWIKKHAANELKVGDLCVDAQEVFDGN